jgi:hypothetical protein
MMQRMMAPGRFLVGRPVKMCNAPVRNLAMLRDEFMTWSHHGDAYFSRIRVQRAPLLKGDDSLDELALKLLSDALVNEKDLLVVSDWAQDSSDPECYHDFLWARGECREKASLDLLNELSESASRCVAAIPALAARIKLDPAELTDDLAWDSYWLDLLFRLGLPRRHPIVRTSKGSLSYHRRLGEHEFFGLGRHMVLIKTPPAATLRRLKKLARAKSCYEELDCGVLRGSAYAIDWLIQEAEARGLCGDSGA